MSDLELSNLGNKYNDMSDESLLQEIANNNNMALDCLMDRYKDIVNIKANKFFRSNVSYWIY